MPVNTTVMSMAVAALGVLCGYQSNIFSAPVRHHQHYGLHLQDDRPQILENHSKDGRLKEPAANGKRVAKKEYGVPKTCPQFDGLHCFETLVMQ